MVVVCTITGDVELVDIDGSTLLEAALAVVLRVVLDPATSSHAWSP